MLTERHPGIVITIVAGMRRLCFPHLSETGFQVLGGQEQLSCVRRAGCRGFIRNMPGFSGKWYASFRQERSLRTREGDVLSGLLVGGSMGVGDHGHGSRSSPRPVRAPAPLVYKHATFRKGTHPRPPGCPRRRSRHGPARRGGASPGWTGRLPSTAASGTRSTSSKAPCSSSASRPRCPT